MSDRSFATSSFSFISKNIGIDDAEKELRAIASANPTDTKAGLDLVRFLANFGGAGAAKDELSARIRAGGDVYPYQMALVDLDLLQGNSDEAVGLLNDIIKEASPGAHSGGKVQIGPDRAQSTGCSSGGANHRRRFRQGRPQHGRSNCGP